MIGGTSAVNQCGGGSWSEQQDRRLLVDKLKLCSAAIEAGYPELRPGYVDGGHFVSNGRYGNLLDAENLMEMIKTANSLLFGEFLHELNNLIIVQNI